MKKNLLLRLCLIITVALSLYSCRTEDEYVNSDDTRQNSEKFAVFTSRDGEDINYSKGFQALIERYDSLYDETHTANALQRNSLLGKSTASDYIEFNIRSQDILWEAQGERWILYPIINDNTVTGIAAAILRNDETEVEYRKLDPDDTNYKNVILPFTTAYMKARLETTKNAKGSGCGFDGLPECVIQGVIIIVPSTPKGTQPSTTPLIPPSKCSKYKNCLNPEPGGGNGGFPELTLTPCQKTKAISTDPAVKAKVGTLKEQSKIKGDNSGEKGFNVNLDGTTSEIIPGEKHSVDLGSEAGKQGGYHNHTPDGIKMHSPPDILKMLNYALAQPNGNISNGFLGFVGSEKCGTCPDGYKYHNYIIRFSGNSQELEKFIFQTNWDKDALDKDYADREDLMRDNPLYVNEYGRLNNNGLQKLFFETLKNMGMEGKVALQKVEDSGSVQNIILDNAGNPSPIPCP